MDTLKIADLPWDRAAKASSRHGAEAGVAIRQNTAPSDMLTTVKGLLARVRRIRPDQTGQTQKWVFRRESTRIAVEIPVTISTIDERGRILREVSHTIDVSRKGAKIATSTYLAVGTHLWVESSSLERPAVARVVRHGVGSQPGRMWETCVELPEVNRPPGFWRIESSPEDWQAPLWETTAATRLARIFASDWATRFQALSKAVAPPVGFDKGAECQPEPPAPSLRSDALPSSSEKPRAGGLVTVTSRLENPAGVYASPIERRDAMVPPGSDLVRNRYTSDVDERLTPVCLAEEALEGRVGALVEGFQGKGALPAEDLEKVAQELGGRWSEQFQEQVEAAVEKLREEVKDSARVVEESKRQLASLAEAKLASLSQALRDEYGRQLVQALREHAQATHEAADVEVESIKQAAQEAVARLQVAEQKEGTSFKALAGAAEKRLRGVSKAVEALEGRVGALVEGFQGKGALPAEDLEKVAQELGGRWSEQFQEQVEAAVEKLREEVKD